MNTINEGRLGIHFLRKECKLDPEVLSNIIKLMNSDCYLGLFVIAILVKTHKQGFNNIVMGEFFEFCKDFESFGDYCIWYLGNTLPDGVLQALEREKKNNFGLCMSVSQYYEEDAAYKKKLRSTQNGNKA